MNDSTNHPEANDPSDGLDQDATTGRTDSQPTGPLPQEPTGVLPASYSYPPASPSAGVHAPARVPAPARGAAPGPESGAAAAAGVGLTDEPAAPRRRRTGLVVGSMATVVALGVGGVLAYNALSGGGDQPAEVLPGDAFTYVRLDIDPSAGQKIAAVRFLDKIPELKDTLGSDDPRRELWKRAAGDSECLGKLDYDKDVATWLGDRVGLAVRPGGTADEPNVVLALQVTDEGRAAQALPKVLACDSEDRADLRMKDGYALITPEGQGDETVAAVDKGSLADNQTFADDMAALGEQGILSTWVDGAGASKAVAGGVSESLGLAPKAADAEGPQARVAAAMRFDPGFVEVAGIVRGLEGIKQVTPAGGDVANLPDDTMLASHLSGGDQLLGDAWPQLKKTIDGAASASGMDDVVELVEKQLGIKLPDDLQVLLGSSLTVALPEQDLDADEPVLGARLVTKDAARAEEILTTIEDLEGSSRLTKKVDGDRLYVATTPDYADRLRAGGRLGDSDAFKAAVDDPAKSVGLVFVDLDKLEKAYLDEADDDLRGALESLRAVGLSASVTGDAEVAFAVRVVGN